MFYWISKILSYFLAPSIWILALFAWPMLVRDKRKMKRRAIVALIAVYLLMNAFLVDEVMRWWEWPMEDASTITQPYDLAVVLGGHMVTLDKQNNRRIYRTPCDRIIQGFELYRQGKVNSFLLSGGPSHFLHKDAVEAVWLSDFLLQAGVPEESILVDSSSRNTHENAVNTAEILGRSYTQKPVLLITSSTHMRRAVGCFRDVGLNVYPWSTDKIVGPRRYDLEHLLIPDTDSLLKWRMLTHEMVGYVAYRLVGYL